VVVGHPPRLRLKTEEGTMTKQISFTKQENELLPDYRNKLNQAESVEDVRKFFIYAANELHCCLIV